MAWPAFVLGAYTSVSEPCAWALVAALSGGVACWAATRATHVALDPTANHDVLDSSRHARGSLAVLALGALLGVATFGCRQVGASICLMRVFDLFALTALALSVTSTVGPNLLRHPKPAQTLAADLQGMPDVLGALELLPAKTRRTSAAIVRLVVAVLFAGPLLGMLLSTRA